MNTEEMTTPSEKSNEDAPAEDRTGNDAPAAETAAAPAAPPPVAEPAPSGDAPAEATSAEATSAEATSAEATPEREASAPAEASSGDPSSAEGDASAEGGDEGEEDHEAGDATSAEAGAAPTGEKKKRRRRRKKKSGEGAATQPGQEGVEGAEGAEGAPREGGERKGGQHRRPEPLPFRIGEEVFGKVEKVTDHAIWIDVAGKATGLFDRRDLGEADAPAEGDQFIATVASHGVRGGMLRMARAPFITDDAKKILEAAKESGEEVTGFVTGAVKGGVEVDIDGLRAFAPASHVELRPGGDLGHLVGQRLNFIVVQYEKKGRDVVVSRKKFLASEAKQGREAALAKLVPGSVHRAIVRNIVQWGAFVALPDADNVEGLIHATEASHDRSARLGDLFKPGDEVEVKVLRVDEKGKLWLSRRAMTNDPWDAVKEKYAVGTRHKGKVARIQPFGVFVELEPGIDGLCYAQDLSIKHVDDPKDIVKVGEELDFVIATCDTPTRRISLHLAPPESEANEPRPKVGPHRILKSMVVATQESGLIVRIIGLSGRAARGFIPAGHTGTPRGTDLRKTFPVGTIIEAKVLEVDTRRGETKLSIRAMREDGEKQAYQQYRESVAKEAKFGTFADLMKK